jgi:alginate O-acetyltransferase complex protein AlgF
MKAFPVQLFGLLLLFSLAAAQEGLYDPVAPADSAFVRVIQADSSLGSLNPQIGGVVYEALDYAAISAYQVIPAGIHEAGFADLAVQLEFAAGKSYTVAVMAAGVSLLEDPSNGNLSKTLLVLYNLSELAAVDMKTADGSTAVVSGVVPKALNSMLVNPIQVDLAAFAGEAPISAFNGLSLRAGATYSMVVLGSADALKASWAASTVIR